MRAALNTQYGSPDVLRLHEIDRPRPDDHEVVVQVHASAVTQGDRRLRAADFPGVSALFGRLLIGVFRPRHSVGGTMFAGRVVEVGSSVTRYSVGDDVFGSVMHGAYAEYLAVAEGDAMATMPTAVTHAEAAAIPYGAGTALSFLRDLAGVQPGERVLVVGASGGVGRMAVQIAKHLGAEVTGVCGADADLVRELGADEVIDYRSEDFTERPHGWDVIFDTTEGDHFRTFRRALTARGRYLSLYVTPRLLWEMAVTALRGGPRAMCGVAQGTAQLTEDLRELVEHGAVRAVIAQRFALSEVAAAHRLLEARRPHGSVVIDMVAQGERVAQPVAA
ncbi:MAG: NAD(P)-dependent alcohol dehydrogenase [Polyangiaceae bacterium]